MGKISQGILGPLSQSIGGVTGASVKGRPTLRRKSSGGVNPRTQAQQQSRGAFSEASEYCRENRDAIIAQENFREKKGVTIWNQMMSWYMAGGRLAPTGPSLIDDTWNGSAVKRLIGYDFETSDIGGGMVVPLSVFDNASAVGATVTARETFCAEEYGTVIASIFVRVSDGKLYFEPVNSVGTFLACPQVPGFGVRYSVALKDVNNQTIETVSMVAYADDCTEDFSGNGQARTLAELATYLGTIGTYGTFSGGPAVSIAESVPVSGNEFTWTPQSAILQACVAGLRNDGAAATAKQAFGTKKGGWSIESVSGQSGVLKFVATGYDMSTPLSYGMQQCVTISLPAGIPGVGNGVGIELFAVNGGYNSALASGSDVHLMSGIPEDFAGVDNLHWDGSRWQVVSITDSYAPGATKIPFLQQLADKCLVDWYSSLVSLSGNFKFNNANDPDLILSREVSGTNLIVNVVRDSGSAIGTDVGDAVTNFKVATPRMLASGNAIPWQVRFYMNASCVE